jgi:N-acylneuraminate cytidylyltransferase
MVHPGRRPRPFPERIEAMVLDFDGVMTDNRVWVDENGHEQVAANRSDSLGLSLLRRQTSIQVIVISTEVNPVVAARCQKLRLPYLQGINDKAAALTGWLAEKNLDPGQVIFVGNDVNDLPCFSMVGYTAVPADAQPEVIGQADLVLSQRGGYGAVREICDLLMQKSIQRSTS